MKKLTLLMLIPLSFHSNTHAAAAGQARRARQTPSTSTPAAVVFHQPGQQRTLTPPLEEQFAHQDMQATGHPEESRHTQARQDAAAIIVKQIKDALDKSGYINAQRKKTKHGFSFTKTAPVEIKEQHTIERVTEGWLQIIDQLTHKAHSRQDFAEMKNLSTLTEKIHSFRNQTNWPAEHYQEKETVALSDALSAYRKFIGFSELNDHFGRRDVARVSKAEVKAYADQITVPLSSLFAYYHKELDGKKMKIASNYFEQQEQTILPADFSAFLAHTKALHKEPQAESTSLADTSKHQNPSYEQECHGANLLQDPTSRTGKKISLGTINIARGSDKKMSPEEFKVAHALAMVALSTGEIFATLAADKDKAEARLQAVKVEITTIKAIIQSSENIYSKTAELKTAKEKLRALTSEAAYLLAMRDESFPVRALQKAAILQFTRNAGKTIAEAATISDWQKSSWNIVNGVVWPNLTDETPDQVFTRLANDTAISCHQEALKRHAVTVKHATDHAAALTALASLNEADFHTWKDKYARNNPGLDHTPYNRQQHFGETTITDSSHFLDLVDAVKATAPRLKTFQDRFLDVKEEDLTTSALV